MSEDVPPRVGIVVPTLGTRTKFLRDCLESIRSAGRAYVLIVAPPSIDFSQLKAEGLFDASVSDPGKGLSDAIDLGIKSLPAGVEYVNWLGDDDLLAKNSLDIAALTLDAARDAPFVFGICEYINESGTVLWRNSSGSWAPLLMRVGPDLVPQPGSLIRRTSYDEVGGLSSGLGWAFDLDLFIRLQKLGKGKYLPILLSRFRWHSGSLSVGSRRGSSKESRKVRLMHLPSPIRLFSFIWEVPFSVVGALYARRLSLKAAQE